MPSCTDLVRTSETDIDCGGSASSKCADFLKCASPTDCLGGRCLTGVCTSCADKTTNGGETDVDCGGTTTCSRCGDNKACKVGTDCFSGRCVAGMCVSCTDGKLDGDESDIDCGGTMCPACVNGRRCAAPTDCQSKLCSVNACVSANCTDKVQNGFRNRCRLRRRGLRPVSARRHLQGGDCCATGICTLGKCALSCTDGVKNRGESDVDCGGTTSLSALR
jgi:hypothetical protein